MTTSLSKRGQSTTPPRVLVADDDEIVRWTCRRALEREGFVVDEAPNGSAGIAMLKERQYAMVVSDNRMPGATGLELLAEAAACQPSARRVLMTSLLDPATLQRAKEVAHAYFEKTGALAEFRDRLHEQALALPIGVGQGS